MAETTGTEDLVIETGHISLWTGYFFCVNTIVGAGFLAIPWAFAEGGWAFGAAFLAFSAISGYALSVQLLDVMSRVEVLIKLKEEGYNCAHVRLIDLFRWSRTHQLIPKTEHQPRITHRRVDISECVAELFGQWTGRVYAVLLFVYTQGAQIAYASIFSTSFASNVPLFNGDTCDIYLDDGLKCRTHYWVWLGVFGLLTVYLTIKGLREQRGFQTVMTFMRYIVMVTFISCCVYSAATATSLDSDSSTSPELPTPIDLELIGKAIPIILFAMMYHVNLPSIAVFVKHKSTSLTRMVLYAIITCTGFYALLGIIVPVAIANVDSMSVLSFRNYTAGFPSDERPWWTYGIEYLVILFPALDVLSAYPLLGIALADNLITMTYTSSKAPTRRGFYLIRLISSVPPLAIAALVYDLGTILDWTGLIGLLMVPVAIPLMQVAASHVITAQSPYSSIYCNRGFCYFLAIANLGFFILTATLNAKAGE